MARARFAGSPDLSLASRQRVLRMGQRIGTDMENSRANKDCRGWAGQQLVLRQTSLKRTSVTAQLHHKRSIGWFPSESNVVNQQQRAYMSCSPGVAIPPAAKLTTGRRFKRAVSLSKWNGACISFANAYSSSSFMMLARRISLMTAR